MRNIIKKMIMAPAPTPALFLVLLLLITGGNRHQCEGSAIGVIENSTSGIGNDSAVVGDHHHIPEIKLDNENNGTATLPSSNTTSSSNGTEVIKVKLEEDHHHDQVTPTQNQTTSRCPSHSLPRKGDHDDHVHDHFVDEDAHQIGKVGNQGNGNGTTVKPEKMETAMEQISESISGVMSTIKNSFTSIFSPGTGLQPGSGRHEDVEVDCSMNDTATATATPAAAPGELKGNTSSISASNQTLPEEGGKTTPEKLEEKDVGAGAGNLLIHPVSNNDTINGTTTTTTPSPANETNGTTTSTTVLPGPETSTAAP